MLLLSCQDLSKSFGSRVLFDWISLGLSEGDRLGLIGPNGSGKTTLMEILAGRQEPDAGIVSVRKTTTIGYVPQDAVFPPGRTVQSILEEAASRLPLEEHERDGRIAETLGRVGFQDSQLQTSALSGGWRKRLAIAAELVRSPDVLLLDEPTNHLDLEGILWLEKLLSGVRFASIVISHDRYFLENVATHMAEINRLYPEGLLYVRGDYADFLEQREDLLAAQKQQRESLATKVRREVEWLRRGAKARTGKSKARIGSAERMIGELAGMDSRARTGTAGVDFTATERRTKRLVVAEQLSKALGGRELFRDLDFVLTPGSRMGLVGPNGSGKSTLLRLIQGALEPDSGELRRAENLQIVYFEQDRDALGPETTLRRALAPEGDSVIFRDRTVHVAGWAKRFLFREEQLPMPIGALSGGERARVFIARLMLQPADVLLLDEPTNDLDIPTLEILEDNLLDFPGALVLVTHDRYMLDRVSTFVLGLHGDGTAQLYADYSQYEEGRTARLGSAQNRNGKPAALLVPQGPEAKKKLSYREQREWDQIESRIEEADAALTALQLALQDLQVTSNPVRLQETYAALEAAQAQVDQLYSRWSELEAKVRLAL
jgi:ABC transport system ATP-binding/permease protein